MIQEVLHDENLMAAMTSEDLRGLTPLVYQHITPYGIFDLDLTTRIPLLPLDQEEVA